MNNSGIQYKTKTASIDDILNHLKSCNLNFNPPLTEKADLIEYAAKIYEKSVTFEAWFNDNLIGLVAAYFNSISDLTGFVTNVSVIASYKGKGIATELMSRAMEYAKKNEFKNICLEVNKNSAQAISLYKKLNFYITNQNDDTIFMKRDI